MEHIGHLSKHSLDMQAKSRSKIIYEKEFGPSPPSVPVTASLASSGRKTSKKGSRKSSKTVKKRVAKKSPAKKTPQSKKKKKHGTSTWDKRVAVPAFDDPRLSPMESDDGFGSGIKHGKRRSKRIQKRQLDFSGVDDSPMPLLKKTTKKKRKKKKKKKKIKETKGRRGPKEDKLEVDDADDDESQEGDGEEGDGEETETESDDNWLGGDDDDEEDLEDSSGDEDGDKMMSDAKKKRNAWKGDNYSSSDDEDGDKKMKDGAPPTRALGNEKMTEKQRRLEDSLGSYMTTGWAEKTKDEECTPWEVDEDAILNELKEYYKKKQKKGEKRSVEDLEEIYETHLYALYLPYAKKRYDSDMMDKGKKKPSGKGSTDNYIFNGYRFTKKAKAIIKDRLGDYYKFLRDKWRKYNETENTTRRKKPIKMTNLDEFIAHVRQLTDSGKDIPRIWLAKAKGKLKAADRWLFTYKCMSSLSLPLSLPPSLSLPLSPSLSLSLSPSLSL